VFNTNIGTYLNIFQTYIGTFLNDKMLKKHMRKNGRPTALTETEERNYVEKLQSCFLEDNSMTRRAKVCSNFLT